MNRGKLFRSTVVGVVLVGLLGLSMSPAAPALKQSDERTPVYLIYNIFDAETRSAIAATGALIIEVGKDYVLVEATRKEQKAIETLGLSVSEPVEPDPSILAFPPADAGYHDYAEMVADLQQAASNHSNLLAVQHRYDRTRAARSGRARSRTTSDVDEDEPEVLFTHHQHAREHLTVEMALYTLHMLTDEYGIDQQITDLVDRPRDLDGL